MHVTYSPESGDVQRWEFKPDRVRASKAEMIEKRYGDSWDQWKTAVQAGNIKARRVLLWHLMTQQHPTLRWEEVPDFYSGELLVELDVDELRVLRAGVEANRQVDPTEKAAMLAALDDEIENATARAAEAGVEEPGKARSKAAARSTPSS